MARAWRAAASIKTLQRQINEAFPKRSKVSDGTVGDLAHSKRASDHNPNSAGVVTATDITHDPKTGVDCHKLAAALQKSGDKRIKYIIWNGQITQKTDVAKWKRYTGKNPHKHHLHLSVASDSRLYDDGRDWQLDYLKKAKPAALTSIAAPTVAPEQAGNQTTANSLSQNAATISGESSVNSELTTAQDKAGETSEQNLAENSKPPAEDTQVICKERPSTFVRWLVAIKVFIGGMLASVGTYLGVDDIKAAITANQDKILNIEVLSLIGLLIIKLLFVLAVGVALLWLAAWIYDRSANRANRLNEQKLLIAADKNLITTELSANKGVK